MDTSKKGFSTLVNSDKNSTKETDKYKFGTSRELVDTKRLIIIWDIDVRLIRIRVYTDSNTMRDESRIWHL